MKKSLFLLAAMAVTFMMVSCASTSSNKPEYSVGMIEDATPENSVLVYGMSSEPDIKLYYEDEKSDWAALITTGNRKFSLPPVHKGAKLVVKGSSWEKNYGSSASYGNMLVHYNYVDLYKIENDEWNIEVPVDKPLYYMGIHSIMNENIYSWETIQKMKNSGSLIVGLPKTEEEFNGMINSYELKVLKQVIKQYKGTAWEPVIQERIAELSN